jgi:hypothetical protein
MQSSIELSRIANSSFKKAPIPSGSEKPVYLAGNQDLLRKHGADSIAQPC